MEALNKKTEEIIDQIKKGQIKVSIYGLNLTSLIMACFFAEAEVEVIIFDSNSLVVDRINHEKGLFFEKELKVVLKKNLLNKSIIFTEKLEDPSLNNLIHLINVPAFYDDGRKNNYLMIEKICIAISKKMKKESIVIQASFVEPGVTESIVKEILESNSGMEGGRDFYLAYCPLKFNNDKIFKSISFQSQIIAGINDISYQIISSILKLILGCQIIKVDDIKTTETATLFQNIHDVINTALSNELAILCNSIGLDFIKVIEVINEKFCNINMPSFGFNSQLSINYDLLGNNSNFIGLEFKLLEVSKRINKEMINYIVNLVSRALKNSRKTLKRSKISILGLSYGNYSFELKDSPSLKIADLLLKKGAKIRIFDPNLKFRDLEELGYKPARSLESSLDSMDIIIFMKDDEKFKNIGPKYIARFVKKPASIIDIPRIFKPKEMENEGLSYFSIGYDENNNIW